MKRLHLDVDSDTWYGVTDPKKRKRIQDRLAQRARRKRLANSKSAQKVASASPTTRASSEDTSKRVILIEKNDVVQSFPSILDDSVTFFNPVQQTVTPPGSYTTSTDDRSIDTAQDLLVRRVSTVFAALFNNGRILDIPCGLQVPILSLPCGPKVPLSLHPTQTQMSVLHIPWIDRFPFPKMRDNVIRLSGVIDEEEFLADLFTTDSFTIIPNSVSWDPMGWIVSKAFEQKWGYLFY